MEKDSRQVALQQLLELAAVNGYVTFDDIFDCGNQYGLSIGGFDWLSNNIATRNIIIYENAPETASADDDDVDDYAQSDYEQLFRDVIAAEPNLKPLIDEIRNTKPPQWGEVARLKHQVKEGNQHARQRMIEMYMRIAVRIAWSRAKTYDLDLEATIGDAFVGLIIAVDKYDPDRSGPFISYASMWIFQNITREQSVQNTMIYLPVHRKEICWSSYGLLKNHGCIDCEQLLWCQKARQMVMEKAEVKWGPANDAIMAMLPAQSLQGIAKELRRADYIYEDSGEIITVPEEKILQYADEWIEDYVEISHRAKQIMDIMDEMLPRTREILRGRLGLDGKEKTLEELGQQFGLTRERIRQIEAKGMRQLLARDRVQKRKAEADQKAQEKKRQEKLEKKKEAAAKPPEKKNAVSEAAMRVLHSWEVLEEYNKKMGYSANTTIKRGRGRPPKRR